MFSSTLRSSKIKIYIPSEEDEGEEVACVTPQNTLKEEQCGAEEESIETDDAGRTLLYTVVDTLV